MLIPKSRFYLMTIMAVVVLVITGTCELCNADATDQQKAMYKVYRIEIYYTAEMEMDKVDIITDIIEKYRANSGAVNHFGNYIVDWVKVLKEIKSYGWSK